MAANRYPTAVIARYGGKTIVPERQTQTIMVVMNVRLYMSSGKPSVVVIRIHERTTIRATEGRKVEALQTGGRYGKGSKGKVAREGEPTAAGTAMRGE